MPANLRKMPVTPPNRPVEETEQLLASLRLANELCARGRLTWEQRVMVHRTFVDGIGDLDHSTFTSNSQHPLDVRPVKMWGPARDLHSDDD